MQALIFFLGFPLIPFLVWYKGHEKKDPAQAVVRYGLYVLAVTILTSVILIPFSAEGTSLWEKIDRSPVFLMKLCFLEMGSAILVAVLQWLVSFRKIRVRVAWQEYRESGLNRFFKKVIAPNGIYLLTVFVIALNVSLMFDNVLWGDECFSANTAQKDFGGILQVLYFWDNHPPLSYFWQKIFGDLLGHTGWVYHLSSLTAFLIGIVFALGFMKKRFGNIPTAFFIVFTGMASTCLQYNLEIRMYALAFLGIVGCFYCAYRVLSGGRLAWIGMVFWGLVGAYSHYYGMMVAGVLIFVTGVAMIVRYHAFSKKIWIKSLAALLAYILGYVPWFPYLFRGTENVSNNWWMTEIMGLGDSFNMILGGASYRKIVGVLIFLFLILLLLAESSFFTMSKISCKEDATGKAADPEKKEGASALVTIHRPSLKGWSNEAYAAAVGALTILGTMVAVYLLCLVVGPVLAQRYLYPFSAITAILLVILSAGVQHVLEELSDKTDKKWVAAAYKVFLVIILALLIWKGLGNYKIIRTQVKSEQAATEQTLGIIGDCPEDTALVSNNVKHLAWTVLYYYYPEHEIVTGRCSDEGAEYDRFWYFTPEEIGKGELQEMYDYGYEIQRLGTQQIATYTFELYYFER